MTNQNNSSSFTASPLSLRGPFRIQADLDVHMNVQGRFNIEDRNTKNILDTISKSKIGVGIEFVGNYIHAEYCADVWIHGTEKNILKFLNAGLAEVDNYELQAYEEPEIDIDNFRTPELDKIESRRIEVNNSLDTELVTDSFSSHGSAIHNPYNDESGQREVLPEAYYGEVYARWYLLGDSVLPIRHLLEEEEDEDADDHFDDEDDDEDDGESLPYEYDDQKKERHALSGKMLIAVGTVMVSRGLSVSDAIDGGTSVDNEIIERLMENGVDEDEAQRIVSRQEIFNWLRKLN